MFCFTHTRATFYNPGDTFDLLQELLHKNNIDIPLENGKSYFCFDNEAFRLLACLNNGIEIDRRKMVAYTESWTFASEMTHQMFDQIRSLPPHDTKKTVSMNEARNIVIKLSKPMAEILDVVEKTKEEAANSNEHTQDYELPDGQIVKVNKPRFMGPEALFFPDQIVQGSEVLGLHKMTYETITTCDVDIRKDLCKNIILSGGTTMYTGLADRLKSELTALAPPGAEMKVIASAEVNCSTNPGSSSSPKRSPHQSWKPSHW